MQPEVTAKKHGVHKILIWIMGICSNTTKRQEDGSKKVSVAYWLFCLNRNVR